MSVAAASEQPSAIVNDRSGGRRSLLWELLVDPWLWGPAVASLLAPPAAAWRAWVGWTIWCTAVLAAGAGYLLVAAGTVLLGLFGSLLGFSPDWASATASFGAPAALSTAVLATTWHLTRRVAGRADTTATPRSDRRGTPGAAPHPDHESMRE